MTFTDALMQAKRASQLRGVPFSTRDVSNLQSAYMSGAAERAAGGRAAALAEKTLAGQKMNFAETLAQEKTLSAAALTQEKGLSETSLAQTKTLSEADLTQAASLSQASLAQQQKISESTLGTQRQLAADKIAADKAIEEAKGTAAREAQITQLAQEKELFGLSSEQARQDAAAQIAAQEEASQKALTGNVISTGASLGGLAYLLAPTAKVGVGAAGTVGAAAGAQAAAGIMGAAAPATLAPPVAAGGAGMAMAPTGFGASATGMGALGTAATVAGVVAAPYLIYRALGGGGKDEAGPPLTSYTPEQFGDMAVRVLTVGDLPGTSQGENWEPTTPEAKKAEWTKYYDAWFKGMKEQYGQDVPKTMSAEEAWAQSKYYTPPVGVVTGGVVGLVTGGEPGVAGGGK